MTRAIFGDIIGPAIWIKQIRFYENLMLLLDYSDFTTAYFSAGGFMGKGLSYSTGYQDICMHSHFDQPVLTVSSQARNINSWNEKYAQMLGS